MARHRISSLDGRGIADFDELIHKKVHRILRSCLTALYFDLTTLIEIAVYSAGPCFNKYFADQSSRRTNFCSDLFYKNG